MKKKAFKAALPYTLPICVGFLFLGMSYGFLMRSMGSPCWINIKMSDKYQNVGWKKFYLIYGMCDETFSVNCTTEVPEGVDKGWFMFFVTLLNQIYWVGGATAGALLGTMVTRFLPFLIFPEGKEPPEFLAIAFIVLLHRWKKSILLSIGGGTVFYMLLVQFVFCK